MKITRRRIFGLALAAAAAPAALLEDTDVGETTHYGAGGIKYDADYVERTYFVSYKWREVGVNFTQQDDGTWLGEHYVA